MHKINNIYFFCIKRVLCPSFKNGFCKNGILCKYGHPKFNLINTINVQTTNLFQTMCALCGRMGHRASNCNYITSQSTKKKKNNKKSKK